MFILGNQLEIGIFLMSTFPLKPSKIKYFTQQLAHQHIFKFQNTSSKHFCNPNPSYLIFMKLFPAFCLILL